MGGPFRPKHPAEIWENECGGQRGPGAPGAASSWECKDPKGRTPPNPAPLGPALTHRERWPEKSWAGQCRASALPRAHAYPPQTPEIKARVDTYRAQPTGAPSSAGPREPHGPPYARGRCGAAGSTAHARGAGAGAGRAQCAGAGAGPTSPALAPGVSGWAAAGKRSAVAGPQSGPLARGGPEGRAALGARGHQPPRPRVPPWAGLGERGSAGEQRRTGCSSLRPPRRLRERVSGRAAACAPAVLVPQVAAGPSVGVFVPNAFLGGGRKHIGARELGGVSGTCAGLRSVPSADRPEWGSCSTAASLTLPCGCRGTAFGERGEQ